MVVDDNNVVFGLIFYCFIWGMMLFNFDLENRYYGVDIVVNLNESVLVILDGIVILFIYMVEIGYVIQIQYGQDFVLVYKYCGLLLKKEGDLVKGGEVIVLVGNIGEKIIGLYLYFELWYKGCVIDFLKYIVF